MYMTHILNMYMIYVDYIYITYVCVEYVRSKSKETMKGRRRNFKEIEEGKQTAKNPYDIKVKGRI